jgi:two-component system OmpR family response regulator
MPAGDRLLPQMRASWWGPLLVMLTGADQDALAAALDAGAEDAVSEQASDRLVAARIAALLRRGSGTDLIRLGALSIDPVTRRVSREGAPIALLPREYAVLLHLARAPGRAVSRIELREAVWGLHFDPGTNVVEVHVSRLRAKLDRGFDRPMLLTERGSGYRLVAEDGGRPARG